MSTLTEKIDILQPDRHNFPGKGLSEPVARADELSKSEIAAIASIPTKAIQLRLLEAQILDNFDGFLHGRKNEIKLVSVVYDGTREEPFKFEYGVFPGIEEGQLIPMGDAGLTMYFSEPGELPRFLDWRLLIVEDDSGVREVGKVIRQVQQTDAYKDILKTATSLVNPAWKAVLSLTSGVITLIANILEQNKDDTIALFAASYTLAFDKDGVGVHTFDYPKRARVKYEIRVAE